jgi:hypothetical protein
MVELNDFIHVYDDAIETNVCQYLVSFFENSPELQEKIENERKPNFTQINLTENCKITEDLNTIHNYFIHKTFEYKNKYYEFTNKNVFPESHAFEQFRIKRYLPDSNEAFDTHVDVSDHETSRRFLSFMWYLNDVEVGGETQFKDLIITPKMGKLVVFPPLWLFPHKGLEPISNPKYIISTYLHYK